MIGCDTTGARRAFNQWLHLRAAARLLGRDVALVSRRTRKGDYGIVRRDPDSREVLVSLRGLELAARRTWSLRQILAAQRNEPLPPDPSYYSEPWDDRVGPFPEGVPFYTADAICAETAVYPSLDDEIEPEPINDDSKEN